MNSYDYGLQPLLPTKESHTVYDAVNVDNSNQKNESNNRKDESTQIALPMDVHNRPVRNVYIIAACAAINSCNVGFDIGVNSPAGILVQESLSLTEPFLQSHASINRYTAGTLHGIYHFFALAGALLSSQTVQWWGMRASFLISSALFVVGLMIMVLSTNYPVIMSGRVLVGLGVGFGFAVTPNYITEISPKEYRGFFTSWSEIGCNVGILLGFSTSLLMDQKVFGETLCGWRLMFALGCILPLALVGLTFAVMVESPRWLVRKGRYQDSAIVLSRLYPPGFDVATVLKEIQKDIERERDMQQQEHVGLDFGVVRSPVIRRMLLIGLGIAISHELCGIDAIQYYLTWILKASGITGKLEQARFLIALGFLKLVCLFVSSSLVDSLGRRPLMFSSVSGMITALLLIATEFYVTGDVVERAKHQDTTYEQSPNTVFVILAGLAMYLASFSLGMGPLGWVMPPEIFSTSIRSNAVSLTTFANRLTATMMTSTMLSIADALGWGGYFCLLAAINLIILVLAYMFLPETKGRRLEEMTDFFS